MSVKLDHWQASDPSQLHCRSRLARTTATEYDDALHDGKDPPVGSG